MKEKPRVTGIGDKMSIGRFGGPIIPMASKDIVWVPMPAGTFSLLDFKRAYVNRDFTNWIKNKDFFEEKVYFIENESTFVKVLTGHREFKTARIRLNCNVSPFYRMENGKMIMKVKKGDWIIRCINQVPLAYFKVTAINNTCEETNTIRLELTRSD